MRRRLLPLAWIALAIATFVGGAAPASAANGDGPVGTAARVSNGHVCDLVGGPLSGQDVWAFAAPSGVPLDGLTATFTDAAGAAHRGVLRAGDQAVELDGRSIAWLVTPAGWQLTAASAGSSISATEGTPTPPFSPEPASSEPPSSEPAAKQRDAADEPVLVGACAAVALAPGRAAVPASGQAAAPPPTTTAPVLDGAPEPVIAAAPDITAAAPDGVAATTLAATGQDIGSMFVVGWALVMTGALLLIVRRRRRAPRRVPSPDEPGMVWLNPPSR